MKLLLDEHLSPRLIGKLADRFTCDSVLSMELGGATDREIITVAAADGWTVVTKDSDFIDLVLDNGSPKLILLDVGNCSTEAIATVLVESETLIQEFVGSEELVLVLAQPDR